MMSGQSKTSPQSNLSPVYAFGSFRLDPSRGLLYHGADVTPLPDRLAQLLVLLIHANGNVIDKETIASRIWPETTVSDGNLSQHVYMLRQLLDERAKDRAYVMTVRGKGYRFVTPVSVVAPGIAETAGSTEETSDRLLRSGPEALQHYCRGCYLLEKRTASSLTAAAEQFEAALAVDQEYVPALIGLARAYALLAE
jgi:DNA-binding winged helix-turn-helix (wHTH) protein